MLTIIKILIVVFGCGDDILLEDRINAGIDYALKQDNATTNVHWLLSGGIKNPLESTMTEAFKMSKLIAQRNLGERRKWTYIMDEDSTNTAENLVMIKAWLSKEEYESIVFVTSAFHRLRVKVIADEILEGAYSYDWVLSSMELPDSKYWEGVHIKNAMKDARNALRKCSNNNLRSI
jgi:hypothetical protein